MRYGPELSLRTPRTAAQLLDEAVDNQVPSWNSNHQHLTSVWKADGRDGSTAGRSMSHRGWRLMTLGLLERAGSTARFRAGSVARV